MCWLGILFPLTGGAQIPDAPVAVVRPVTNTYFGVEVVDPYRWMEDSNSTEFQTWMKLQSDSSRAKLESLPIRKELLAELRQLDSTLDTFPGALTPVGKRLFYMRTPPPSDVYQLFMREGWAGAEKLIFDPGQINAPDGSHYVLNFYHAAPDGKHAVCRVSQGGSEDTTLEIVEVDTSRIVDKPIDRVAFGNVNWLPNGGAFFYTRRPKTESEAKAAATGKKGRVFVHFLGTDVEKDRALLGYGLPASVPMMENQSASINTSSASGYMVAEIHNGVDANIEVYVAPLVSERSSKIAWQKVCGFGDEVTGYALQGRELLLLSRKDAPCGKLLRVSCEDPKLAQAALVIPGSKSVLSAPAVTQDGFYISLQDGISSRIRRVPRNSGEKAEELRLPVMGSVARIIRDPRQPGVILSMTSWTEPTAYYSFDVPTHRFTKLQMKGAEIPELLPLEAQQVNVRSKDGTQVPLTIICRSGLEKDGHRPALLSSYGAYGMSQGPSFDLSRQPWFARGGVYAVAHVRGGGEFGKEWHLAGKGKNKQNGVDDFIACAEYLVSEHYTSPEKLAVQSVSAGGVLVGQAIMQRPELFGAAVIEVGALDALRFEATPNGPPNVPEWGSIQTREGFESLRGMSPYEHVRPGTHYPAVLLTTGINDRRVEPWQSAKMAARLQAANAGEKPILLSVNYAGGHFQTTLSSILEHQADIWTFLLWQLGETGQPQPPPTSGIRPSRPALKDATKLNANPAEYYQEAFNKLPTLFTQETDAFDLEKGKAIIKECSPSLNLLRKAALAEGNCDWGLANSAGPDMLMANAGPAQHLAKVGCLAAQYEFQTGDSAAAERDLLAVLMLGRRMGNDLTLNSVLIQFAIEYMVTQTWAGNVYFMPHASLESFTQRLQRVPARKTVADAMRYDQKYMLGWFENRIAQISRDNLNEPKKAMNLIIGSLAKLEDADWPQRLQHASANDPDAVLKLLHETESFYDEAARV
ncbi:MAG: hypothetical protein JWQ04_1105, partial [Pedosphaera sp.]|nr:hypothetical protein [Pedosphaera sp.]